MKNTNRNPLEQIFVPLAIAQKAIALGFREDCLAYYSDWAGVTPFLITCEIGKEEIDSKAKRKNVVCVAPCYSQILHWLREEKHMEVTVHTVSSVNEILGYEYELYAPMSYPVFRIRLPGQSQDYYEVLNQALQDALNSIK